MNLQTLGREAREAFRTLSRTGSEQREMAVQAIATELHVQRAKVAEANLEDIAAAIAEGLSKALIDRLTLSDARIDGLVADVGALAGLIYESRPNVTIDVAALAVKTGNAVILRGGKETIESNRALIAVVKAALRKSGLPQAAVQFIDSPERALVGEMLRMNDWIDVIVPRGGRGLHGLHEYCRQNATIPVITGGIGVCHLFVDASADLEAALPVIHNAKTQRPSVCNALDTLLVHETVAADFLPQVVEYLARRTAGL